MTDAAFHKISGAKLELIIL